MGSFEKALKEEIRRLARREVVAETKKLRSENGKLRKAVAGLRKELAGASKQIKLVKKSAGKAAPASSDEKSGKKGLRPTSKTILKLRSKFRMSQGDFAKLLGVSLQSVVNWENAGGRLKLRAAILAKLEGILKLGMREAHALYEQVTGSPVKGKARGKRGAKAAAKASPAEKKATGKKRGRPAKAKPAAEAKPAKRAAKKAAKKTAKKKPGRKPGKKAAAKPAVKVGKGASKKPGKKRGRKPATVAAPAEPQAAEPQA